MAALSDFETYVADLLSPIGPVRIKRMFGGAGIYAGDRMFGLIAFDAVYFKVDDQTVGVFETAGSKPFTYTGKTKPIQMSYWRVPDDAFDDADAFCRWARLGIEAANRAPEKSKRGARPKSKSRAGTRPEIERKD
ncbi:MAG: TfoX/Sxy family protein [Pseudomonadota bacterium]